MQGWRYCARGEGVLRHLRPRVERWQAHAGGVGGAMSKHVLRLKVAPRFLALTDDGGGTASESDLAAINALPGMLSPLTADEIFVRSCDAINTRPLFNGLVVPEESVRKIAALAFDHPIQRNHDTYTSEGLPVGRIFSSTMVTDDQGDPCNRQRFYMVREPLTESLVRRMDGGVLREVSISFAHDLLECSICNTDLWDCSHVTGEDYEGQKCVASVKGVTEYYETSLVWAGMAQGTSIKMAAARFGEFDAMLARKAEAAAKVRREVDWFAEWAKDGRSTATWPEGFFSTQ
jgi:hypothetical protein